MIKIIKYGLMNSCRLDIIYHHFFRYQKLRINLIKSFTSNILIITQWYIIYYLINRKLILEESYILSNLVTIGFILLIVPVLIINVLINHHWRQQIVDEIRDKVKIKLKQRVDSKQVLNDINELKLYILRMINNYFNSIWFYNINNLLIIIMYQSLNIIGLNLIGLPLRIIYMSLITSMYACEYIISDSSLKNRIDFAEKNWCYLIFWSLPTILLFWLIDLPIIIQWSLMEFWTMCQMINCLYIQIPYSEDTNIPIMFLQRRLVPIITERTFKIIKNMINSLNKLEKNN